MARDDKADDMRHRAAEVDALTPYLELAREIRREVERFAADDSAEIESLSAALDAIPQRERAVVARSVFDQLEPAAQWAALERLFGDAELRAALDDERTVRLAALRRDVEQRATLADAVSGDRLDLGRLPAGTVVSLGLFRPEDVRAAVGKGRDSDVCARLLVLRSTGDDARFRVVDDVFNPRGGLFVAAAYDHTVWAGEQLTGHSDVRIGSLVGGAQPVLEPVLYLGARVDVQADGHADGPVTEGRLHLGYALLGDDDAYATRM